MADQVGIKFLAEEFFKTVLLTHRRVLDPSDDKDWNAVLTGYLIGRGMFVNQAFFVTDMVMQEVCNIQKVYEEAVNERKENCFVWED